MFKTRNLNVSSLSQFLTYEQKIEMTEDTRHSGALRGCHSNACLRRSHFQHTSRCLLLVYFAKPCWQHLAADNSALTHNVVLVNTPVPSCVGTQDDTFTVDELVGGKMLLIFK